MKLIILFKSKFKMKRVCINLEWHCHNKRKANKKIRLFVEYLLLVLQVTIH